MPRKFRLDIEGLRAVAVLFVLGFHSGLAPRGGFIGVDIFFVISGFLITGHLLDEAERTGSIKLVAFYAKRAKRLAPAASLVLLTSAGTIYGFAPITRAQDHAYEVVGAASYIVNWLFAARSVDYNADDTSRSPVLHFWSLAVEEQFYFLWPLVVLAVAHLLRARGRVASVRWFAGLAISLLVLVPSFVWSVVFSVRSPGEAYFVTTTRLWELAVGAILAAVHPILVDGTFFPKRLGSYLSATGSVTLVVSALACDRAMVWPGYLALLPTLGAALVIAGGTVNPHGLIPKVLSSRPLVWIGATSYSLYLWHWPLLVLGADWLHLKGWLWGSVFAAASILPAWLSYRFIEQPTRSAKSLADRPWLTLSVCGNLTLASITAGLSVALLVSRGLDVDIGGSSSSSGQISLSILGGHVHAYPPYAGAGSILLRIDNAVDAADVFPHPALASKDMPSIGGLGCLTPFPVSKPSWCTYGDPEGHVDVAVLGDSKMEQYRDALDKVGLALGWKFRMAVKACCTFTEASIPLTDRRSFHECSAFNKAVWTDLEANPPDVVVTSQHADRGTMEEGSLDFSREGMIQGLVQAWTRLEGLGVKVLVILDNPKPPKGMWPVYECMLDHMSDYTECSFDRTQGQKDSAEHVQRAAAERVPRAQLIDMADYFCPHDTCKSAVGGVTVYRMSSHITNTYAKSLAPVLEKELGKAYADAIIAGDKND